MLAAHLCFSEVSVNHLFDDPDSEKKILLEKSLEKVLYFEFKILYEPWVDVRESLLKRYLQLLVVSLI